MIDRSSLQPKEMDSVASFQQKTTDSDEDIRFMGVSDLNSLIVKNGGRFPSFMAGNSEQRAVLDTLLSLVHNESDGLVQEQVQKCFGIICASESLNADVCQHALAQLLVLAENLRKTSGDAAECAREAVFLALKAAVTNTPRAPQLKNVGLGVAPKLFSFIQDGAAPTDFRVRACECLAVVLQTTPDYVQSHPEASTALFSLLVSSTLPSLSLFRRRLVSCLVSLSVGLTDSQMTVFIQALCSNLDSAASAPASSATFETLSVLVQIISPAASASNGSRLSFFMKDLLPVLAKICGEPSSASMDTQDDEESFDDTDDKDKAALDELRSLVFQACEALIGKSALATFRPLADQVVQFAAKFVAYDPDYFGDDQEDSDNEEDSMGCEKKDSEDKGGDEMMDDDGECFSGEDFSGSDFGDDDLASTSWKVRRDVLRCLVAIASVSASSVDLFGSVITQVFPLIIKRVQDHDENVRAEALSAACAIFRSAGSVISAVHEKKVFALTTHLESLIALLMTHSAVAARKVAKLLCNDKSLRIRSGCVQVASSLVRLEDILGTHKVSCEQNKDQHQKLVSALSDILAMINNVLGSAESGAASSSTTSSSDMTTASLRMDSLAFVRAYFSMTSVSIVSFEQAVSVASTIARCVTDSYLRSAAEAMRVVPSLVATISRLCSADAKDSASPCVEALARAVIQELGLKTIDHEVKDAAIHALASILSEAGDLVSPSTRNDGCLPVLLTALRTPESRMSGIKAILTLATSRKPLDLSSVSGQFLAELCESVKINNKQQRQTALAAAAALMEHEAASGTLAPHQAEAVFTGAWSYLSDTDLYISHLVLRIATCAVANGGPVVKSVFTTQFMSLVDKLLCGQTLQGTALSSLVACFRACGAAATFPNSADVVGHFAALASARDTPRQAILPIASVCAAYVNGIPDVASRMAVVQSLFNLASLPLVSENQTRLTFGMLALGNVGRENDLSSLGSAIVDTVAVPAIANGWDDLRSAAAYMLGCVTAGAVPLFLQALFTWSKKASEPEQYYVLSALRELSSCLLEANNAAAIEPFCTEILQVLKALTTSEDEGKRSVAAECLGKLCLLVPQVICTAILEMYTDSSKENRTVAATATRFALCIGTNPSSDNNRLISEFFYKHADSFVTLLGDPEVQVRRATLVTLNSVIRQNSLLIPGETLRKNIAPLVLHETEIRNELIEKIRVGTSFLIQDHGLEARKVAFDCLSAILLVCPEALDLCSVLSHLGAGLRDDNDIVIMAIGACSRLTSSFDSQVFLPVFDKEITPALEQLLFPPKKNKNTADPKDDSQIELKKTALRLVALIKAIPSVTTFAPAFSKMVSVSISSDKTLAQVLKEVDNL